MEYLKTGFNQIKKAQKLKPKKRKYLEKLIQISEGYKLRKDHRPVTHILPNQMSDLTAYNDEELNAKKDELLKALK